MSSSSSKIIVLKSLDDKIFEIEKDVALKSQTIAHMIEDDCANNVIPLPVITGEILTKVIDYCKKHTVINGDSSTSEEELEKWDAEFMKIDQSTLFDLSTAANFLHIKGLLDLTCQTIADMIKDKSVEEMRTFFNIQNDFSPEEEAAIREENQWAFD